eukprot:914588-Prorocentrum_minimum.AAC.3
MFVRHVGQGVTSHHTRVDRQETALQDKAKRTIVCRSWNSWKKRLSDYKLRNRYGLNWPQMRSRAGPASVANFGSVVTGEVYYGSGFIRPAIALLQHMYPLSKDI